MKISVIIPAYNSASTIKETLDSVFRQTLEPDEILVMDDGSTDQTPEILNSCKPRITVFRQPNAGLSSARNVLCAKAQGQLIAFLDHDDLWHPRYLEIQYQQYRSYQDAAMFFAGHLTIYGGEECKWSDALAVEATNLRPELISPLKFFKQYNRKNGPFCSYSFCCIPRAALIKIGLKPFQVDGAEDFYCTALLSLVGPAVYTSAPLAAYRVQHGSLSSKRLEGLAARVQVFERLHGHFREFGEPVFVEAFNMVFASHRRLYAKYLMGASKTSEARQQLQFSIGLTRSPVSFAKSLALLSLTYLPALLQPRWPTKYVR